MILSSAKISETDHINNPINEGTNIKKLNQDIRKRLGDQF